MTEKASNEIWYCGFNAFRSVLPLICRLSDAYAELSGGGDFHREMMDRPKETIQKILDYQHIAVPLSEDDLNLLYDVERFRLYLMEGIRKDIEQEDIPMVRICANLIRKNIRYNHLANYMYQTGRMVF